MKGLLLLNTVSSDVLLSQLDSTVWITTAGLLKNMFLKNSGEKTGSDKNISKFTKMPDWYFEKLFTSQIHPGKNSCLIRDMVHRKSFQRVIECSVMESSFRTHDKKQEGWNSYSKLLRSTVFLRELKQPTEWHGFKTRCPK